MENKQREYISRTTRIFLARQSFLFLSPEGASSSASISFFGPSARIRGGLVETKEINKR